LEVPKYWKADFPDLLGMGDEDSSDYAEIEREDHIFTAHILPEDQHHFIHATATVSHQEIGGGLV
jgi:hypothetical protein